MLSPEINTFFICHKLFIFLCTKYITYANIFANELLSTTKDKMEVSPGTEQFYRIKLGRFLDEEKSSCSS